MPFYSSEGEIFQHLGDHLHHHGPVKYKRINFCRVMPQSEYQDSRFRKNFHAQLRGSGGGGGGGGGGHEILKLISIKILRNSAFYRLT